MKKSSVAQRGGNVRMDLCHVSREPTYYFPRKSPENTLFTKAVKIVLMRMATIYLRKLMVSRPGFTVGNDATELGSLILIEMIEFYNGRRQVVVFQPSLAK